MIDVDIAAHRHFHLLAGLLEHDTPPWRPDEMPPLGHWLLFPPDLRRGEMGPDGHPARDRSVYSRRMWAGSRVRFLSPVPLGATVRRETGVIRSEEKQGRSGGMLFVTHLHRVFLGETLAIEEEQDVVYRHVPPGAGTFRRPAPQQPALVPSVNRTVRPGPIELFRYSALTYNAHRIHYDRTYAVEEEGYPGLVTHGPLIATLLVDLFLRERPGSRVSAFSFRALRPIFDDEPILLGMTGDENGADLVAIDVTGGEAMHARLDC